MRAGAGERPSAAGGANHGIWGWIQRFMGDYRQATPHRRVGLLAWYAWKAAYVGTLTVLHGVLFNPWLLRLWVKLLKGRVEFFGTSGTIADLCLADYYVKRKRDLNASVFSLFLANKPHIANRYLASFLASTLGDPRTRFVLSRFVCRLLTPLERRLFFGAGPTDRFTRHAQQCHELNARYRFHLERRLPMVERQRARGLMRTLGLPLDGKFVCVHAREAGFKAHFQPDGHNTYRDIDILTYVPAITYLIERGFWVVRMGEPTVKPLPAMERLIDYARSPLKSECLDVVLVAECEFLLGCNSGFSQLARLFNKLALWTNSVPIEMCPWDELALWIPRLLFSTREDRFLTFPEIVSRGVGQYHRTQEYEAAGLIPQENSAEEILEATQELYRWFRGKTEALEDRQAQHAFNRLFPPHYNAYGTRSRICASFIRAHAELMPQADAPAVSDRAGAWPRCETMTGDG